MPKLLVLANLELTFDVPEDGQAPERVARFKERRLLRLLRKLAEEDPEVQGELESLEYESFSYASELRDEATGYYYNKHEQPDHDPEPRF